MTADPRAALSTLVAALETHLETAAVSRGDDDPAVVEAYERIAEAFTAYDDALMDAFGEVTPLEVYDDDLASESEDDDDEEDDDDLDEDDEDDDEDEDDDDLDEDDDEDDDIDLIDDDEEVEADEQYLGLDDEVDDADESPRT